MLRKTGKISLYFFLRIIVCLFLFINNSAFSREINIRFNNITIDDGLPGSVTQSVLQDTTGFIWIIYEGGLARYDGYQFDVFSYNANDSNSFPIIYPGKAYPSPEGKFFFHKQSVSLVFDPYNYNVSELDLDLGFFSAYLLSKDSTVWIGSKDKGLLHFDKNYQLIEEISLPQDILGEMGNNSYINTFFEDFYGDLWMSVTSKGILRMDKKSGEFDFFPCRLEEDTIITGASKYLGSRKVHSFCQSDPNRLWLGTLSGIVKFDLKKEQFTHFRFKDFRISDPQATSVVSMHFHKGLIWSGTTKNGIYLFDIENEVFVENFLSDEFDPATIVSNHIQQIYWPDDSLDGVLWIATLDGLSYVDFFQKPFEIYTRTPGDSGSLVSQDIRSIHVDERYIMFGGDKGLDVIEKTSGKIESYTFNEKSNQSVGAGIVGTISRRDDGQYWLGTWSGSLSLFDPEKKRFTTWLSYHNDIGLTGWSFSESLIDEKGNFWLVPIKDQIHIMPPGDNKFTRSFRVGEKGLPQNNIRDIYPEKDSDVFWFAADNGLWKLNITSGKLTNHLQSSKNEEVVCSKIVSIYKDEEGIFWLATEGCGLLRYDVENDSLKYLTTKEGFPSDYIYSVYEDKEGFLWMSSSNGISKLNKTTDKIQNYFKKDGLHGNEFYWGAHAQDDDGKIYFGGKGGVTAFIPDNIQDNPCLPTVNFTNLYIKNKLAQINKKYNGSLILDKPVNLVDKLTLKHQNNDFAIEMMATHYANPSQNKFMYRMKGYDSEWHYTNASNRKAFYANLPAGSYVFEAKAANVDGIWGESIKSISIEILPRWWQTLWIKLLFLATIIALMFFYIKLKSRRYKKHQIKLQELVEEKTAQLNRQKQEIVEMADKLHASDQSKINFLTNLSHEFRTPLTLILGPVNSLLKEFPASVDLVKSQLSIVQRNSQRLVRLINQLLEISELDAGTMKLKVLEDDIVGFVRSIALAFEFHAQRLGLNYQLDIPELIIHGYFDGDKLEKILYNLISNALKFTKRGDTVKIKSIIIDHSDLIQYSFENDNHYRGRYLIVEVSDTGKGVPGEEIDKVFDRFYQVSDVNSQQKGTGIGLSLTRDLIKKHKGDIRLVSTFGEGSEFSFYIPLDRECYKQNEIVEHQVDIFERIEAIHLMYNSLEGKEPVSLLNDNRESLGEVEDCPDLLEDERDLLLVVEDSLDMRRFIVDYLANHFRILEAENGKSGLELAQKEIPDLIISDVMMPMMNGIQMCHEIKSNKNTSHIPLILLTAKSGDENQITGLEFGADDYITKPFNVDALILKIKNILNQRKLLHEKFAAGNFRSIKFSSMDENFINRLNEFLELNISDNELNAETFAMEMGYSRPHFYRKLKALTGQHITAYIRIFRLKKAADMIRQNHGSISEIAYKVGFNSPSYFSRKFKEFFGKTPNEYYE